LNRFDQWRLVVRKGDTDGGTVEVAHEALFREWARLQGWLEPERARLEALRSLQVDALNWDRNGRDSAFLNHRDKRLAEALALTDIESYRERLLPLESMYLAACRAAEQRARRRARRVQTLISTLLVGVIIGLVGWINQIYIADEWHYLTVTVPYERAYVQPHVLSLAEEQALKPEQTFRECASEGGKDYCPEMVVVPAGTFMMGRPPAEKSPYTSEDPQHSVTIGKPFAVSKYELTYAEWDTCATFGDCQQGVSDNGWGRGQRPVTNVSWADAERYVAWLSKMTGKSYRLLSEAEYEYAARAGTQTPYYWGNDIGKNNANCLNCGGDWDGKQETAPVGSYKPNAFDLYDMEGNVFAWVEDCVNPNYNGAPTNGLPWLEGDCKDRVARGGSWFNAPVILRSANRAHFAIDVRLSLLGFRVARTLGP
jgi:formylglycine-generating enzyme required for sulfatase activity